MLPCPWQVWVAPCTAHLKAGSNIASICLRNILLHQFRRHRHGSNFIPLCQLLARTPLVLLDLDLPLHALQNAFQRGWHFLFKLAALKHNQNKRKHHATAVPAPRRFWPLFTMLVRFLTALCTTWNLPKSKILLGYFKPTPKYHKNGLDLFIFKKTC